MKQNLEEKISCAIICGKCDKNLNPEDKRILSVGCIFLLHRKTASLLSHNFH